MSPVFTLHKTAVINNINQDCIPFNYSNSEPFAVC